MGYDCEFKLKGELDKEFVSYWREEPSEHDEHKYKEILVATCLAPLNGEADDAIVLNKRYDKITFAVRMVILHIVEMWKYNMVQTLKDNDNTVNFCGWDMSRGYDFDKTLEQLISDTIESLFELSIIDAGKYFDESNDYFEKKREIKTTINYLDEEVWDVMNHKFLDRYRDSDDAIERSDDNDWGGEEISSDSE